MKKTPKERKDQVPPAVVVEMKVRDVAIPHITNVTSSIQKPAELVGGLIWSRAWCNYCTYTGNSVQLLHINGQFTSWSHEDSWVHIQNFLKISDIHTPIWVNSDYVRLTLFPFSLLGEATWWVKFDPTNSISPRDDLSWMFLIRFFPYGASDRKEEKFVPSFGQV